MKPQGIEFFDREKEARQIMDVLKFKPRLITLIYGPVNSGKTALVNNLIEGLPEDYVVFYINLRGQFISDYRDFIRVLFTIEKTGLENILKRILKPIGIAGEKTLYKFKGIPVDASVLETFFTEKSHEDVFKYLEEYFKNISKKKTPVLIIDELQVIGDLKVNEYLIYKLFNFFIRLTKELHLCHVFALSSDSLFIEKVYSEAMLQGRCQYLLVDDFSESTAGEFLEKYGFDENEVKSILQCFGGKPAHLTEAVYAKLAGGDVKEKVADMLKIRTSEIKENLRFVRSFGDEIEVGGKKYPVEYKKLLNALNRFKDTDMSDSEGMDEISKRYLVNKNILFADPTSGTIKPQSKTDLNAIREILKETES